ncbi:MAG TPA: site-specific integrase [Verrucomicrobiota bacterium]|nr:site-specific integrase [Verrucomicrobiota bacterium]
MIEAFYPPGVDVSRFRCGPLNPHIDDFAAELFRLGYSPQAGRWKIRLVADLSQWLERGQRGTSDLNEEHIGTFLRTRKKQRLLRRGDRQTLARLLQQLRQRGVTPGPCETKSPHPVDQITADYTRFLSHQRGLSPATVANYLPTAERFLKTRFGTGRIGLDKLRAVDVTDFILREGATRTGRGAQLVATALRSFLGFLTESGRVAVNLAPTVPTVAGWPGAELPSFLEPQQVQKLLDGCDQSTPLGRRDYAVLLLLARMGLRGGEVVGLSLDDINWEAGEVLVRGKSAREDRLPLLPEVGQALARYLKKDRPAGACRRVFLRIKAPRQGFANSAAICDILRRALGRANLHPEHQGAHLLRRSLATQMLRGGASLSQIGQVLRHQLVQTTEIYAKVDVAALRALAQPWPGGAQ